MPLVTVCLAVYNGENTLTEALESVRAQSFRDFDLLVLDDGSTDRSAAIAEDFEARVLRQPNQGLGAGRRRLIAEAEGDLIAFLDHDDSWTPEKLERQVDLWRSTGALLVHSDCWYEYEDGRVVERNLAIDPVRDAFDHILPSNLVVASSALFNRHAMLEAGNFVADTVRCSDWYGWFLLASRGQFAHLPEKQVHYKVLSSSLANAGYRFHEAQRYLLLEHVLPKFDDLFARIEAKGRSRYRRMVLQNVGVASSSMAKYLDKQGRRSEARALHREALEYAPTVARVWTRALKNRLGS